MYHLRRLWPFVARYRARLLLGLLFAAASAALTASIPLIVRRAVDDLNVRGIDQAQLLRYGGFMVGLALVDSFMRYGLRMTVNGASYLVEFDLRERLFSHLITLDQGFFGTSHTGDLMTRVTNDLSSVRQFLGPGITSLMNALLFLLAAGIMLLSTNVQLALLVLLLLPGVTIMFVIIGRRMQRIFRSVQDQFGRVSTRAQENFSGIRTVKAYAQERAEIAAFNRDNEAYRALNLRYVLLSGILWPAISFALGLVAALVLFFGGRMVAAGTLSLGDLVLFNTYLGLLAFPMIALGWTVNLSQQAAASMERIGEVLRRRPTITSAPDAQPVAVRGSVAFASVGVRYMEDLAEHGRRTEDGGRPITDHGPPTTNHRPRTTDHGPPTTDRQQQTNGAASAIAASAGINGASNIEHRTSNAPWLLRDITFRVPAGTSLAIVGATGAGKTTLVNLLARVRDPDAGRVFLDGYDVRELPLDTLRAAIGYVPQETFLFSVPLRENVTFGRSDAAEDQIDAAVTTARLSNDLEQFPDGLDTLVGERGVTLSGGQKQRTAIARAVLRDPHVLVLDDALSSVDTHTAAQILSGLRDIMRNRTTIIIAQRIATVKDADQIIVLHDGRIVERGTHQSLLARNGHYAAMERRERLEAVEAG